MPPRNNEGQLLKTLRAPAPKNQVPHNLENLAKGSMNYPKLILKVWYLVYITLNGVAAKFKKMHFLHTFSQITHKVMKCMVDRMLDFDVACKETTSQKVLLKGDYEKAKATIPTLH